MSSEVNTLQFNEQLFHVLALSTGKSTAPETCLVLGTGLHWVTHTPRKEHSDPERAALLKKSLHFQVKMYYEIFVFQMQKYVCILYLQRQSCSEALKATTDLYH